MLRSTLAVKERTLSRRFSQLAPLVFRHQKTLGLIRASVKTLELDTVHAVVTGLTDCSFRNSALTGLGLIVGHDLLLSFPELFVGVALIICRPLIEAACDLVLNVGGADLHTGNNGIAIAGLEARSGLEVTKRTALFIPYEAEELARRRCGASRSERLVLGLLVLWQEQPVLLAFVVGNVEVNNALDANGAVPGTEVAVTLATEDRVTLNKRKLEVFRIWVVCPNAQLLPGSCFPLVDSAECVGPVRQADRVGAVSFALRGVDR